MDYKIRFATPDDHDLIYALKTESIRPYVEKIWGWDENYQRNEFDYDFSAIGEFFVIEVENKFAGFYQYYFQHPYNVIVEIHLLSEYRNNGIGSAILRNIQKICDSEGEKMRIGCFKENYRAKCLYQKLGFIQIEETDTHCILEYGLVSSVDEVIADATSKSNSVQSTSSSDDEPKECGKESITVTPKPIREYGD